MPKRDRNALICELSLTMSLTELAQRFNISKQRVHQIVSEVGVVRESHVRQAWWREPSAVKKLLGEIAKYGIIKVKKQYDLSGDAYMFLLKSGREAGCDMRHITARRAQAKYRAMNIETVVREINTVGVLAAVRKYRVNNTTLRDIVERAGYVWTIGRKPGHRGPHVTVVKRTGKSRNG